MASGGLLSTVANVVVSIAIMFGAIALSPDTFKISDIPLEGVVRVLVLLALVVGLVIMLVRGIPLLRRTVMPPLVS